MIRSKLDSLVDARKTACLALEEALKTSRGTREARDEAALRRMQAAQTHTCACCGAADIGSEGYCDTCNAAIKRMLAFKSSLAYDWPKSRRLRTFIADYQQTANLPYSLRGSVTKDEMLTLANNLLRVVDELEAARKAANRRV